MIDFLQLQKIIKEQLEHDREIRTVDASGPTLEAAVNEAASLLDTSIRRLEYEILERGSSGFMGAGKKDWVIRAYEHARVKKAKLAEGELSEEEAAEAQLIVNKDGDAFAQCWPNGVFLKVTLPAGNGRRALLSHAMQALSAKEVKDIDMNLVERIVD